MFMLEEQVNRMLPIIDSELESVDRHHAKLTQLSTSLVEAINMYHLLMRESDIQSDSLGQMSSLAYRNNGYGNFPNYSFHGNFPQQSGKYLKIKKYNINLLKIYLLGNHYDYQVGQQFQTPVHIPSVYRQENAFTAGSEFSFDQQHFPQMSNFIPNTIMTTQVQPAIPQQVMTHPYSSAQQIPLVNNQPISTNILPQNNIKSNPPQYQQQR